MGHRTDIENEIKTAVESLQKIYQFQAEYSIPTALDEIGFYRIVSKYLWNSASHPKSARKHINDFQNDRFTEYYTFQPEMRYVRSRSSAKEVLNATISPRRNTFKVPTPRDVSAAKEVLKRTIILYIYFGPGQFYTEKYIPNSTEETEQPIYILVCNKFRTYIEFQHNPQTVTGALQIHDNHEKCFWKRYRNSFEERSTMFYDDRSYTSSSNIPEGWEARQINDKTYGFFKSISMAVYGTEDFYQFIIGLTLEQEQHKSTIDCYAGLVTSGLDHIIKDREAQYKYLTQHLKKIKNGEKKPQDAEFYAVATLFQTDIFIGKMNASNEEEWRVYQTLPMIRQASGARSKSFIPLFVTARQAYLLLKPQCEICTCSIQPPEITGCLQSLSENPEHFTDLVAARWQVCCQRSKRGPHCHFREGTSRQLRSLDQSWGDENGAYDNRGTENSRVDRLLKQEKRRLDLTIEGRGTFDKCIHKEVYETEYSGQGTMPPSNENIQQKSKELGVPIFILHADCRWRVYIPDNIKPSTKNPREKCRYYITLFFDDNKEEFIRILPENECNCRLAPPTIRQDNTLSVLDSTIPKSQRHFPMIEFFEDKSNNEMETEEIRRNYNFDYHEILKEIKQRPDMQVRNVDVLDTDNDNFFACISKEIFGNESHASFVRQYICKELMNYCQCYECLMTGDFDDVTDYVKVHTLGLEMGLPVEDIDIVATASFFQTPIYILVTETDGRSRWIEYTQMRTKRMPSKAPERKSKCRQMNTADKYFISLLRVPAGKYHRIIPTTNVCNCFSEIPRVPREFNGPEETPGAMKRRIIYRNLYNATQETNYTLDLWGNICDQLVSTCKKVIDALIEHRRKTNAATILGSTVGLIGGGLFAFGIGFAPLTGGVSGGISVIGGLIGLAGGGITAISKVIENALTKKELQEFEILMKLICVVTDKFKEDTDKLRKAMDDVSSIINTVDQRATTADDNMHAVPSIVRGVSGGLHFIPVLIVRISFRSLSLFFAKLFGGISAVLDLGLLANAINNLAKGSTTEISQELEKKVNELLLTKLRYNIWAYGYRDNIL